jgi:hypothetical protein
MERRITPLSWEDIAYRGKNLTPSPNVVQAKSHRERQDQAFQGLLRPSELFPVALAVRPLVHGYNWFFETMRSQYRVVIVL